MNSGQNKNFFKILKKSVAKIVRFFCATLLQINRSLSPYRPIATDDITPSVPPADREKNIFSNMLSGKIIFWSCFLSLILGGYGTSRKVTSRYVPIRGEDKIQQKKQKSPPHFLFFYDSFCKMARFDTIFLSVIIKKRKKCNFCQCLTFYVSFLCLYPVKFLFFQ